jgi:hypothetical protein
MAVRQGDAYFDGAAGILLFQESNGATMEFQELFDYGEAQAGAVFMGGKKRGEDMVPDVFSNTRTLINHLD